MSDEIGERLDRIEAVLAASKLPLERRVDDLEGKVKKLEPRKKDFWEKLQAGSGVVVALVTAFVGYWLTGSVNVALERSKLETSNVEKMRDLITKFNFEKISPEEAEALGLTLAAFGRFAVPSLLAALGTNTVARAEGARTGLLAVGLHDRAAVCDAAANVIANRSQRFTYLMHRRTVDVMGLLECDRDSALVLRDYLALVAAARTSAGLAAYAGALDPAQPVERDEVAEMFKRLCALSQLKREVACTQPA